MSEIKKNETMIGEKMEAKPLEDRQLDEVTGGANNRYYSTCKKCGASTGYVECKGGLCTCRKCGARWAAK